MNLLEFHNIISSENSDTHKSLFSEEITLFNIINGNFADNEIIDIAINEDPKFFSIKLVSEDLAEYAERKLNMKIVPGAYKPLYQITTKRNNDVLILELDEV